MVALSPLAQTMLSVVMLGSILCLVGGGWMLVSRRDVRKGALLVMMAVVLLGNVLVWAL